MIKNAEQWLGDCLKGTVAALLATVIFALAHYTWAHVPQIWQYVSQFASAIGVIKITRK